MIKTKGLTHIHLLVKDLERSLTFYTSVFGMEEKYRVGKKMVFLSTPGSQDLVTLHEDSAKTQLLGKNGGIEHFGFQLTKDMNLDEAVRIVERAGGKLLSRGEHAPGYRYAYVSDPDGYVMEL